MGMGRYAEADEHQHEVGQSLEGFCFLWLEWRKAYFSGIGGAYLSGDGDNLKLLYYVIIALIYMYDRIDNHHICI